MGKIIVAQFVTLDGVVEDPDGSAGTPNGGWAFRRPELVAGDNFQLGPVLDTGVQPEQIAVIAPYAAQVRLLREQLAVPGLEIDSVDGFQGREKEAVVVSLVRSNRDNDIGFLADVRRMNVALTRARRLLLVVGDSATLAVHPFYERLFSYFESAGACRSVWEEDCQ